MQQEARDALRDQIRTQVQEQVSAAQEGIRDARESQIVRVQTGAGPGRTTTIALPPDFARNVIPPQAVDIALAFFFTMGFIIVGLPIARAFARRIDRSRIQPELSPEVGSQLAQLTAAVDSIAIEVERISEGQRFATRLLSEQRKETPPLSS